jgi:hypothetical protein
MNDNDNRIRCNATVDVLRHPPAYGGGVGLFRVHVMGFEPHDYVRTYEIEAADDNMAARRGLDRFVEEISELLKRRGDVG